MARTSTARLGARPIWLRTGVAALAFVAVTAWLATSTWDDVTPTRQDAGHLTDLRDAVYYPVVALLDGVNPYEPSDYYRAYPVGQEFPLYSPVHLVIHLPLAAFDLEEARILFFGFNVVLMVLLAAVALRLAGFRSRADAVLALTTLLLLSGPGRSDLRNGEPTLLLVLACYLALAATRAQVGRSALGLLVALAKPTFGLPLAIVMLARERVRGALLGLAGAIAVSLVVAIPLADAAGSFGNLVDSLRTDYDVTSRSPQSRLGTILRVDAGNTLARVTGLRPSETAATVVGVALLALGAAAVWTLHRRTGGNDRTELAVTLACLVLLVPLFRVTYDLLLLTWPILLLLRRRPADALWPPWLRIALTALLIFPMVDPLSWSPVRDVVGRGDVVNELLGTTAIGLSLLAAYILCCFAALRPVRATAVVAS
jgi:hypothetical protein